MIFTQEAIELITRPVGKMVNLKHKDHWDKPKQGMVIGVTIGIEGDASYIIRYMGASGFVNGTFYRAEFDSD